MFLRNLNLFIPYFAVSTSILGGILKGLLLFVLSSFPMAVNTVLFKYSPAIIIASVLLIVWWRIGLSPTKPNPEKEHLFNSGHNFVAAANFLILGFILFGYFSQYSGIGTEKFHAVLFVLVVFIAIASWAIGIVRILSSKPNLTIRTSPSTPFF